MENMKQKLSEMWVKNIVKRIIYREQSSSKAYISYMRNKGAKIGDRVTIFSPRTTDIDMTRPWLIDIGNDANSLVNKDIPNNCVVAGNPARVIMPLDKYYEKRKTAQYQEAEELVKLYREHYGKEADEIHCTSSFGFLQMEIPNCLNVGKR